MRLVALESLQQLAAVNLQEDLGAIPGKVHIDQCAKIYVYFTLGDGKVTSFGLYGAYVGTFIGSQAQCNSIMTALTAGATWTALNAHFATDGALAAVHIQNLHVVDQPHITSTNGPVAGASTGTSLPNEVAAVITLKTALIGRGHRGRVYVPNFATTALATGNVIAPAVVTALGNWAQVFFTALSSQGYTLSLGLQERAAYTSPKTGAHFDARAAHTEQVTQAVVRDNHWDSQRRRGLK